MAMAYRTCHCQGNPMKWLFMCDDSHKNAATITRDLRGKNIAERNRSNVSRSLWGVGLYRRVGVKKLFISKIIISGIDWRLPRNTKFAYVKIGKKIYFPMNRRSIFSEVNAGTMPDNLNKTHDLRCVIPTKKEKKKNMARARYSMGNIFWKRCRLVSWNPLRSFAV